jgi:hypothetical protein
MGFNTCFYSPAPTVNYSCNLYIQSNCKYSDLDKLGLRKVTLPANFTLNNSSLLITNKSTNVTWNTSSSGSVLTINGANAEIKLYLQSQLNFLPQFLQLCSFNLLESEGQQKVVQIRLFLLVSTPQLQFLLWL